MIIVQRNVIPEILTILLSQKLGEHENLASSSFVIKEAYKKTFL